MIPFLDKTAVKLGIAAAIILGLIAFYKWHHDQIFEAGANSVRAELAGEYEKREKVLTLKLGEALAENQKNRQKASQIQVNLDKAAAENRRLRDEINDATFECTAIGGDFMELWNKTISKPSLEP